MADVDVASIADAITVLFEDKVASTINRATVSLELFDVEDGGAAIQWDAEFGSAVGAARAEGADVSAFNDDELVPALLDYGTYDDAFAITGKALAKAYASGNPKDLEDLFGYKIMRSAERLAKGIAGNVHDGTGATDQIAGFRPTGGGGALGATGTYAGIDRATYPQWAATVKANGGVGRALSLDLMRETVTDIYKASGLHFDAVLCDPDMHRKYGALIGQERRYVQQVTLRGQTIVLDGGYQVLEFDGRPVIMDVDAQPEEMLFLSSNDIKIKQLPSPVRSEHSGGMTMGIGGTPEHQLGASRKRLQARVNFLAKAGDKYKFQLIAYPGLQVRTPNRHGVLADIDPTL